MADHTSSRLIAAIRQLLWRLQVETDAGVRKKLREQLAALARAIRAQAQEQARDRSQELTR